MYRAGLRGLGAIDNQHLSDLKTLEEGTEGQVQGIISHLLIIVEVLECLGSPCQACVRKEDVGAARPWLLPARSGREEAGKKEVPRLIAGPWEKAAADYLNMLTTTEVLECPSAPCHELLKRSARAPRRLRLPRWFRVRSRGTEAGPPARWSVLGG